MTTIDWMRPVKTLDGHPVRVLCVDGPNKDFPVIGIITGANYTSEWTLEGMADAPFRTNDVINTDDTRKRCWVLFDNHGEAQTVCTTVPSHPWPKEGWEWTPMFEKIPRIQYPL